MITTQELRTKFVEFFKKNGHEHIESSPLIPQNDSTLLFANAGMNQFKDYFTGKAIPKNKRAVTVQKCVRAGGKHNDLENVGHTARHHTFFEMLGNFSFGDYFKKEAISLAWKFLTEELKIPKDKLYITVHHSDDEAMGIWNKNQSIPLDRIFKRGDKDNFWEMGDTGPCGPCSEIFFDHGPKYATENFTPGPGQSLLDDEKRYVEIWNLVFMQFEKTKDGMHPLPNPSIDTGAGLERLAAVVQGKYWNYDTDLFAPIIKKIENVSSKKYSDSKFQASFRVVADHIRSSTLLITDGVIPSNEGRGYVLRRIIRRAVRHLRELGINGLSMHLLVPSVFESLVNFYPENSANATLAEKLLQLEEKKFLETLDSGIKFFNESLSQIKEKTYPGDLAFKLYDTYGFPLDLTEILAQEKNLIVSIDLFNKCMEKQKENSRASWKGGKSDIDKSEYFKIKEKYGPTKFLGYEHLTTQAKLLNKIPTIDGAILIFDQTTFYGESGGQLGDIGVIKDGAHTLALIADTQKPVEELYAHLSTNADALEVGKVYTLEVDRAKRELTKRNHSATHLLQAALIKILGPHVKQAGSSVGHEKLRFDFTHLEKLSRVEIEKIESLVNEQIKNALPVTPKVMAKEQALQSGALAFFGEKYSDQVRVLKMGDFSTEFCGGTHVSNTKEIGIFTIVFEGSVSSGVRRIEALTSDNAILRLSDRSKALFEIEQALHSPAEKLLDKILSMEKEVRSKNKEIESLRDQLQEKSSESLFLNPISLDHGIMFKALKLDGDADLRKVADLFISKNTHGIFFGYINKDDISNVILRTNKSITNIDCNKILKSGLEKFNGRGGGRPDMAQGSLPNKDVSSLEAFILNQLRNQ